MTSKTKSPANRELTSEKLNKPMGKVYLPKREKSSIFSKLDESAVATAYKLGYKAAIEDALVLFNDTTKELEKES